MAATSGLEAARRSAAGRTDKRAARTEKAIREAYFRLLGDIDYDKISVSALSREAGIDRKTFYLHYKSIDALVEELLRERTRLIVRALVDRMYEREGGGEPAPLDIGRLYAAIWGVRDQSKSRMRSQMRHMPLDMVLDRMPDLLAEAFVEDGRLTSEIPSDVPSYCEQLCASFVGAGMIALFRRWLFSDQEEASLEEAAELAEMLVFDGLHGVAQCACAGGSPATSESGPDGADGR